MKIDAKKQFPLLRHSFGLMLIGLAFILAGCSPPPGNAPDRDPEIAIPGETENHNNDSTEIRVVATRLTEGPIDSFIEISTDVESLDTVDVYPLLSGIQITEISADEGDYVEKGAQLATLDSTEIELQHADAEVNYLEAKQRLAKAKITVKEAEERKETARITAEKAKKDYDKSLAMYENELVSEDEFAANQLAWEQASSELALAHLSVEQCNLDLDLNRTEVDRLKIALDSAALKLSRTRIRAPFNGFITYRGATLGMTISATSRLFTLVNRDKLVANLYIPQEDLLRIKIGLPVVFRCDALPHIELTGAIRIINPVVDPASGTVKLRAEIDPHEEGLLRPGMFVTARIITASKKKALLIARKAVFYDDEKPTFFLIKDDDTVRKIHFRPGATTDTVFEIASALPPDESVAPATRIVIVGQDNLKDGDKVLIVEEIP